MSKLIPTFPIQKSLVLLLIGGSFAFHSLSATLSDVELYQNVEFEMPVVQEPVISAETVNIVDFGAVSGGFELCTDAIQRAIDTLAAKAGGKVIIPAGTWLTGPITLRSHVNLHTETGALVIFSSDKSLYPLVETDFEGYPTWRCQSPINGRDLEDVAFTGEGVFDGSGDAWRAVKNEKLTASQWKELVASGGIVSEDGKTWYPSEQFQKGAQSSEMNVPRHLKTKSEFELIKDFLRPVMVSLINCNRVLIDGPTFQNSPAWNIHPLYCTNLTVRNATVRNPWYSQNGDGIDIDSCKNVVLHDCSFDVGDDAICIKSGKDKEGRERRFPTENLVIKNCVVFHGHGGVTVGSEMSSGVRNMHVSNCTFIGTDVGLRFKSTRGRGGVVENIYISDVRMKDIPTQAISFNLFYSGRSASEDLEAGADGKPPALLPVTEETPQFRNITMRNITCNGARTGILLQGLPEMNLENVELENIRMQCDYGLICSDANNIHIRNLTLETKHFPVVELKDSREFYLKGLTHRTPADQKIISIDGYRTGATFIKNAGITDVKFQVAITDQVPEEIVQIKE